MADGFHVDIGPQYEGEVIRKEDLYIEFGGPKSPFKFELATVKSPDEIENEKIEIIGPDISELQPYDEEKGGGSYPIGNNLVYSFSPGREDGTDLDNKAPGGGSPTLRRQLRVLSEFLHSFALAKLEPDSHLVARAPGVVVRALSGPGKAHALYLQGRAPTILSLNLARGRGWPTGSPLRTASS